MQDARDTFYVALRGRLAAINPSRTIVLRGQIRPGILVAENELATTFQPTDAFVLCWTAMTVDTIGPMPLVAMECQIAYATDGTPGNGGMDRGRLLSAMDGELLAALTTPSQSTPKFNYSAESTAGAAPTVMATNIFWAEPRFGPAISSGERIERSSTLQVFAYQEAGEV